MFEAYVHPLSIVSSFLYLGHTLTGMEDDWTEVFGNLWKERFTWPHLSQILERKGVDERTPGWFYLVVAQATLLFESEMWVTIHHMAKNLWGVPPPSCKTDHGSTPLSKIQQESKLPTSDRRDEGGSYVVTGDLHLQ